MYQLYTLRLNFDEPAVYIEKLDRLVYTNEQYQDDITYACCIVVKPNVTSITTPVVAAARAIVPVA